MPNRGTENKSPFRFDHGDKVNTNQCAKFTNNQINHWGYNLHGDAWNPQNCIPVYSGYEGLEKPKKFVKADVEQYNRDASDNFLKKFDSATLDTLKRYNVNMRYEDSKYLEKAFKEGKNLTGTHTGSARWVNSKNGNPGWWELIHNIGGNVHTDRFTKAQGSKGKYAITAIMEPKKATIIDKSKNLIKKTINPNHYTLEKLRRGGIIKAIIERYNNTKNGK